MFYLLKDLKNRFIEWSQEIFKQGYESVNSVSIVINNCVFFICSLFVVFLFFYFYFYSYFLRIFFIPGYPYSFRYLIFHSPKGLGNKLQNMRNSENIFDIALGTVQ